MDRGMAFVVAATGVTALALVGTAFALRMSTRTPHPEFRNEHSLKLFRRGWLELGDEEYGLYAWAIKSGKPFELKVWRPWTEARTRQRYTVKTPKWVRQRRVLEATVIGLTPMTGVASVIPPASPNTMRLQEVDGYLIKFAVVPR